MMLRLDSVFLSSVGAVCLFLSAALGLADSAVVVAEHVGNNDPSAGDSTPWERVVGGGEPSAVSEEPVDSPLPAWRINDKGNAVLSYVRTLTNEEMQMAEQLSWKLSVRCRIDAEPGRAANHSAMASYVDTTRNRWFIIGINANAAGEPVILMDKIKAEDNLIEIGGIKAEDFHLYELVYDPVTRTAALFVDGEQRAADISSKGVGDQDYDRIEWGSGDTGGTGAGDFNWVRFEILSGQ